MNVPEILEAARSHYDEGRFDEAREQCRRALAQDGANVAAVHLYGLVCLECGEIPDALDFLERASRAEPDSASTQTDYGVALLTGGRPEEAAGCFKRSLHLEPQNADVWSRLATARRRTQNWAEAADAYRHALEIAPDLGEAMLGLGFTLLEQHDWPAAEAVFRRALQMQAHLSEAWFGLGQALKGEKKLHDALVAFEQAVRLRPGHLEALFSLGTTLQAMERWDEAALALEKALCLAPLSLDVLVNLGNALWGARRFDAALAIHARACRLKPDHSASYKNLGHDLLGLLRFADATAAFQKALELKPGDATILCCLGHVRLAQNDLDGALAYYEQALGADPGSHQTLFNRSLALLLKGDFAAGFPGYEYRWLLKQPESSAKPPLPEWKGDFSIEGKSLLVFSEQGFGDTLQFVRYLPLLQARGARVTLRVQPALCKLLSCLPGVNVISTDSESLPPFDAYCLLLGLPLAFGTTLQTIPSSVPYLTCDPQTVETWRARLGEHRTPRVGLVWSGNASHRNDYNRSIPLRDLLLSIDSVNGTYYALQKEIREADQEILFRSEKLVSLADEMTDFSITAAIVANLDLVITVDTAIAHLAGALGKAAWVLLPYAPDWRWMLDRADSPWYPTLRLFRQETPGDWTQVIAEIQAELTQLR